MHFKSTNIAFGRNETFGLRYAWIPKGYESYRNDPAIFLDESATVKLGLGKNMVQSMRYWMQAYGIIDSERGISSFANLLLDREKGLDPFLQDINTLWLLHWNLCTNPSNATLYYWFFNHFRVTNFSKSLITGSLNEWLNENATKKVSEKTLDRDISLLLRTYSVQDLSQTKNIEEEIENPFGELKLIDKGLESNYKSEYKSREGLNPFLLAYCLSEWIQPETEMDLLKENTKEANFPISEIMNSDEKKISMTGIFRLDENSFFSLLEEVIFLYPEFFTISEAAGSKMLTFKGGELPKFKFLEDYYIKE